MSNVIEFPGKDEREWRGISQALAEILNTLGATWQEIPVILDRLRPRWEQMSRPFTLSPTFSHAFPGPLRQDQLDAIYAAFEVQTKELMRAIVEHYKGEHAVTLLEFAKLELRLLQAQAGR
jgi:hypothetical protein